MQLLQTELSGSTQTVDQLELQLKKFEEQLQNVQVSYTVYCTQLLLNIVNSLSYFFEIVFVCKACSWS